MEEGTKRPAEDEIQTVNIASCLHPMDADGEPSSAGFHSLERFGDDFLIGNYGAYRFLIDTDSARVVSGPYQNIYWRNGILIGVKARGVNEEIVVDDQQHEVFMRDQFPPRKPLRA